MKFYAVPKYQATILRDLLCVSIWLGHFCNISVLDALGNKNKKKKGGNKYLFSNQNENSVITSGKEKKSPKPKCLVKNDAKGARKATTSERDGFRAGCNVKCLPLSNFGQLLSPNFKQGQAELGKSQTNQDFRSQLFLMESL